MKKYKHTVAELRRKGYKVRVVHSQEPYNVKWNGHVEWRRGSTHVDVTSPSGETVSEIAECSWNDSFSKKRGVAVALNRCMKQLNPRY